VAEPSLFPVALRVAGRRCLVVGGGPVAARKTEALLACDAVVDVVAPDVIPAIADSAARVSLRPYRPGEAAGYRLVLTATGVPAVDHQVAQDAEAAGVWVNSADDAANCSFLLPAVRRQGPITVAVSTAGSSPALAGWLRDRIGGALPPATDRLAALLAEARQALHDAGRTTGSGPWRALLDGPVPGLVTAGREDEARRIVWRALGLAPPR
jgi:siroheme synthase-like protein